MATTWQGGTVQPPFFYRFTEEKDTLVYEAWRAAEAQIHPQAQPGIFCADLWRYDTMEFFIASPDASRYLEFNLCPNGAWWAAAFTEPRVPLPGFCAAELQPITYGEMRDSGWRCSVKISLPALLKQGWSLDASKIVTCAVICRGGEFTYLTSCDTREGKPDFHRPWDWEPPLRQ